MKARTRWLLAIVGLLAMNIVAMIVLAVFAHHGESTVVPGYLEKGIR